MDSLAARFENTLGFQEPKVKEILKNAKVSSALNEIIDEADIIEPPSALMAALLHTLATLSKDGAKPERKLLTKLVVDGKVTTNAQLKGGWDYIVRSAAIEQETLEEESGVGKC
jgi:glutaminyl-tRNA synthetase